MSASFRTLVNSSVLKKQIVAITGLVLVLFILAHLSGNLLILLGPEIFNGYTETLHAVPELLWVARAGLIAAFIVHVYFTILVTMENREARAHSGGPQRYAVEATHGRTNFVKKYMIYTGLFAFAFLMLHLADFTFPAKTGPKTELNGEAMLLFGLVWNSFLQIPRSVIYIVAVWCVGLHLSHGIQSLFQSIGFFHDRYTPVIYKASWVVGIAVAAGFSLIPVYVILRHYTIGPPM
ncbi:MAG: succinate dehydrogenase Cd [Candidatus Hydrogenedentota bacterium]